MVKINLVGCKSKYKNTVFHQQFSFIVIWRSIATYIPCYVVVVTNLHSATSWKTVTVVTETTCMKVHVNIVLYMYLTLWCGNCLRRMVAIGQLLLPTFIVTVTRISNEIMKVSHIFCDQYECLKPETVSVCH